MLALLTSLISLAAQPSNDYKSSSYNLIKDVIMTDGLLVGGKPRAEYIRTYKYTAAIAVVGGTRYIISLGIDFQGGEYDSEMNFLRDIRMKHDEKNVLYTASKKAAFVRLNISNNDAGKYLIEESYFTNGSSPDMSTTACSVEASGKTKTISKLYSANMSLGDGQWKGRKIAWYGTSIPAGYPKQREQAIWSYANKGVTAVGATILNYGVPNGVIRECKNDGSTLGERDLLSFINPASNVNYQKSMLSLLGTENEPDLFVFDYGVNDADADNSDFTQFDPLDPYNRQNLPDKISIASRDKKTFIGAQNWVIDQLLKAKPNARIAFVTHFSRDAYNKSNRWEKLIQVQNALGEYWGIPTCKIYSKTGWINRDGNNTVKLYCPDGIHPASAATTQSVDILTVVVTDFLKGIF